MDCAGSSVAAEWPDPDGGDGAPIPVRRLRLNLRNWVAVATANGQACAEWATRGDERRNTAAHGHGISLGAFRTSLVLGVDERVRFPGFRALGGSSARRLGGLAGPAISPAQRQRPREQRGRPNARNGETGICWPENCGA